jgi:rhodanese-related sulfurtransferase
MNITVTELRDRIEDGENLNLIDVREEYEYEEDNIGALNIPLGELPDRIEEIEDWKNEEVLVHCRSGKRSENAQKFLESQGFTNVRNVKGGMLAWNELE